METSNNKPELIVMLTYHDLTVPNALELFERLKDTAERPTGKNNANACAGE
ncbi:MAG: hypothetical protein HW418_1857 [Anaerolineales bacterium]|jgi:hypothetical protein|nr:hypothetical protein [Anaerolineales bacterium]